MNTKNRALLWEEFHVGGAIALVTLLGGLFGQLALADQYRKSSGEILALFPTLGFPLLAALLLTLSTANSGHLMGGFSRRILRLPVELWSAVLIILLSRLTAVLTVSGLLAAASWGFFGDGPSAETVLMLGFAYLLIQVLDWLRAPAAPLVVTVIGLLLLALLMHLTGFKPIPYLDSSGPSKTLSLVLAFPPAVGVAYALSLAAVGYTRRGAKLDLLSRLNLARLLPARREKHLKPFSTPAAAQTWYERRHAGIFLPVATVVCWMLCMGLYLFVSPKTVRLQSMGVLEIAPFFAFIGAAIAWHLRTKRIQFWRRSRPASYFLRLPVEPVDLVRARIAISTLTFIAVWLAVTLVMRSPFLTHAFHDTVQAALANREITRREIAALVISLPLLTGLLGWIAAHVPWKLVALEWLLGFTISFGGNPHALYALGCLMIALPLIWFGRELVRARMKSLLPAWSLFACLALWAAIAFAIFPYGFLHLHPHPAVLWLATASFAALVVLPFPSLLLAAPGHLVGERSAHAYAARPGTGFTPRRAVGLCVLLVLFATVAWIRSTTEPTFKARLRAEGIPTNYAELDASYAPVPEESNLAVRYMNASDEFAKLDLNWRRAREANGSQGAGGMFFPHPDTKSTALSPQALWKITSDRWQQVGLPVTKELHAIARSGLSQSRYPLDLTDPHFLKSPGPSSVTQLAHQLSLKALVGAVEGRPEDVAEALSDTLALAESLRDEPTINSQSTRMGTYLIAEKLLESAMNRRIYSDEDLRRFQSILHTALQSGAGSGMTENIMTESLVTSLNGISTEMYTELLFGGRVDKAASPLGRLEEGGLAPALDLSGWVPASYVMATRSYFKFMETVRKQRERGYISKDDLRQFWLAGDLFPIVTRSHFYGIPSYAMDQEYQAKTYLTTAETGVAVERYRLANGRLPENLTQLVPQFLDRVSSDPFNHGAPLSYRVGEDGGYVVYSFGVNHEDNHGEYKNNQADTAFFVAPPELRSRPQVAEALPATPLTPIAPRWERSEKERFFHDMASKRRPQSQPAAVPGVVHGEK